MRIKNILMFGAIASYPITLHIVITLGHLQLAVILMGLFYLATIYFALSARTQHTLSPFAIFIGLLVMSVPIALFNLYAQNITLLFLPPIAINLWFMLLFMLSLTHSDEALISRIARMERGALNAELTAYTRRLTWIWTALFAVMAAESLLLALYAPLETWSWFTNVLNYVFVAILFAGEYIYRRIHFRQYQHASPLTLFRMLKNGGWQRVLRSQQSGHSQ